MNLLILVNFFLLFQFILLPHYNYLSLDIILKSHCNNFVSDNNKTSIQCFIKQIIQQSPKHFICKGKLMKLLYLKFQQVIALYLFIENLICSLQSILNHGQLSYSECSSIRVPFQPCGLSPLYHCKEDCKS